MNRSAACGESKTVLRRRKKTADAVRAEIAREVDNLLNVVFAGLRSAGRLDLEAIESATRAAMHKAGAVALNHLLKESGPVPVEVACECGQRARYRERRSRDRADCRRSGAFRACLLLLLALSSGQSPRDRQLDILNTGYSPGVRRMMAVVGSDTSFDKGCEQMELLAGLEVTRKAVERCAEAIDGDIAQREQADIQRPFNSICPISRVVRSRFSISKSKWTVLACRSPPRKPGTAKGKTRTSWHILGK